MADPRYEIDAGAPDLGPALALFAAARNQHKQNDRADQYMQMEKQAIRQRSERESAAVARQKAEDDRKHAIEAYSAMPMLQRAASKSVGMANANPYGVHFDETQTPPDQGPADTAVGGFLANDQPHEQAPAPERQLLPNEEGPEQSPDAEAGRFAGPEELMDKATGGAPLDMLSQAAASSFAPPTKKLTASYQGQTFDVPQTSETTGLGEEYDRMFRSLVDAGERDHDALKIVTAQYKSDKTQEHIASRTADQIEARRAEAERSRPDVATQSEFLDRRLHQSDVNSQRAAAAHVAGAAPNLKADAANARDMSVLRQQGAAIRSTGQYNKLAASDKTVRGIFTNIASGSVPLQHADAQIQLARFFRQAQPTEGEMHMLYNNLGGTADKWNQFIARLSKGDLSAEQMHQLRASAAAVKREHQEDLNRFVKLSQTLLGPGSGFDNMPDQAEALYKGMATELGIENPPPLYGTAGGVTLGSGQRPTVQPKGTKKTQLDELESYLDSLGGHGGP